MSTAALLAAALVLAAPGKKPPASPPAPSPPTAVTRTLSITDANVRDVFPLKLAVGQETWLLLPAQLSAQVTLPAEVQGQLAGNVLILSAAQPIAPQRRIPLAVPLQDGPPLIFEIQAATDAYDQRVTIERKLGATAAADSPQVLSDRLQQCRDELQEARGGAVAKDVFTSVIADLDSGKAPALVRRELGQRRKQHFLHVRLLHSYRLFDWTFVTLELENREGGTVWVLGDAAVRQMGASSVLSTSVRHDRPAGIKGGEVERVVLGFESPADNTKRFALTLTDKAGTRNVTLEDLDL